jgi:hypothetical protein
LHVARADLPAAAAGIAMLEFSLVNEGHRLEALAASLSIPFVAAYFFAAWTAM